MVLEQSSLYSVTSEQATHKREGVIHMTFENFLELIAIIPFWLAGLLYAFYAMIFRVWGQTAGGFGLAIEIAGPEAATWNRNLIFLVTGHSRGGAVGNIVSARLNDHPNIEQKQVFGYSFAAPSVLQTGNKVNGYENIFCFNNDQDLLINILSLEYVGWGRYGNKIEFPGGQIVGITGGGHRAELFQKEVNKGLTKATRPLVQWVPATKSFANLC